MKLSNKFGMPEPLARAASALMSSRPPTADRFSVTDLLKPPQIRQLEARHWDEIEEDVGERLWPLLGTVVHQILHSHAGANTLSEEKLTLTLDGTTIVGIADLYEEPGIVTDWKFTSVWAVKDIKPEWVQQLNCYAHLYTAAGLPVNQLRVYAIFRDWSKHKAETEHDYPRRPYLEIPVALWDSTNRLAFMSSRLAVHRTEPAPQCTIEERWARPERWAVTRPRLKRAIKLCDSSAQAIAVAKQLGNGAYVQKRPASSVRCALYCSVAPWCPQWAEETTCQP